MPFFTKPALIMRLTKVPKVSKRSMKRNDKTTITISTVKRLCHSNCMKIGPIDGGTDIIAAIIHKYKDVTLGRMIMACDFIIISSCYVVFHDWRRVIFGFVTLFVIGFVLDYIVNSARQSVQFFIFSKEYEKIADRITKETHRGVTVLDGIGWYSKHNVKVLVVLAYKRQSVEIFRMVKDIDPNAFISQSSVIGVYGEGFDRLKVK